MKLERERDNQQWLQDYLVKTTGRPSNFFHDVRIFPTEVKSYAMIPRVMAKIGRYQEALARTAEERGHTVTALDLYLRACESYHRAQHAIPMDDNPLKLKICDSLLECYDRVIQHSPYIIEKIEIPWEGKSITGLLHLVTRDGRPQRAPCVLFAPGMDMTKENYPTPRGNPFVERGMHVLSIDGPGQGISNIRKIRVTADNYERAAKAAVDYLLQRPEIEGDRIAVYGVSRGSFWASRIAALDQRLKALAVAAANFNAVASFELTDPHFKRMFMYMAGIHDEARFDKMVEEMTIIEYAPRIKCPALIVGGEFDPRGVDETEAFWDGLAGPKELWVLENEFHTMAGIKGLGGLDAHTFAADWIKDALQGKLPADLKRRVVVGQSSGLGPYSAPLEGPVWARDLA